MAKQAKTWLDRYKEYIEKTVVLILGVVLGVTSHAFVQQKPSYEETRASQNATYMAHAYSAEQFPNHTATGKAPRPGYDVAVSPDVADKLLGKKVYIIEQETGKSLGVREVTDMMSSSNKQSIDLLVPTTKQAKDFGTKPVKVIVLER